MFNWIKAQFAPSRPERREGPSPQSWKVVHANYRSLPVAYPDDYLQPLQDPGIIEYKRIDFKKKGLPRYQDCYAAVLDNVLTRQECRQLLRYIEMSAGLHREADDVDCSGGASVDASSSSPSSPSKAESSAPNGWRPAGLNGAPSMEILVPDHRRGERIIWDEEEIARRVWARIIQSPELKQYLSGDLTDTERYPSVSPLLTAQSITITKDALNKRLRCLKYTEGDFFAYHTDNHDQDTSTEGGRSRTFFTVQIYLNDSVQAVGKTQASLSAMNDPVVDGGSTSFKDSARSKTAVDVWPKTGRVLIFQHARLGHIGGEVASGTKYTIRSNVQFHVKSE